MIDTINSPIDYLIHLINLISLSEVFGANVKVEFKVKFKALEIELKSVGSS